MRIVPPILVHVREGSREERCRGSMEEFERNADYGGMTQHGKKELSGD